MLNPPAISTGWHPLARGFASDWASGWGQDGYGVFVEFTVKEIIQKMRWIPPGRFLMGSPESEKGRLSSEGPQHGVTISQGFWLFDTPCTQSLWQAVMGENPSRFEGEKRPVEQVSRDDISRFLETINGAAPDLALELPSEAQWEHACRAGTTTAYSYGNKPGPHLMNVQETEIGETTPVDRYPPNPWGLYDMHGNVWERCRDNFREYDASPALDPEGPEATGDRVMRGGSWLYDARHARAAYRYRSDPEDRYGLFGFRCARVQA